MRAATVFGLIAAASVLAVASLASADPSALPPPVIYNYDVIDTARSGAMGGALRALGGGTTGLLLNPADIAENRLYHLEAIGDVTPETQRQVYGGAIVDSVTGRLSGGLAIFGGFMDPDGLNRSFLDVRLALAYPITERLFVGITGRYAKIIQSGPGDTIESSPPPPNGVFGPSDKVSGGLADPSGGRFAMVSQFDFDFGITVKATDNLYLGLLGQNLAYAGNGLLPTMIGGGIGVGTKDFTVEVDGVADLNSWGHATGRGSAGAEYLAANHVPIRLGYQYDQGAKLNTLSGGVGFLANEFSIETGVKRTLSNPGETTIILSLAYFLESSGLTRASTPDM